MAEEVGFEPTVRFHARRFSRPVHSTTLPLLRPGLGIGRRAILKAPGTILPKVQVAPFNARAGKLSISAKLGRSQTREIRSESAARAKDDTHDVDANQFILEHPIRGNGPKWNELPRMPVHPCPNRIRDR